MKRFVLTAVLGLVGFVFLGGPNRRPHDHIGNFNFKVEIEGVTQGVFGSARGGQASVVELWDGTLQGKGLHHWTLTGGQKTVRVVLVEVQTGADHCAYTLHQASLLDLQSYLNPARVQRWALKLGAQVITNDCP